MWISLIVAILSQGISLVIAETNLPLTIGIQWISSIILWIAFIFGIVASYLQLANIWDASTRLNTKWMTFRIFDVYVALQLSLSSLGMTIYLLSSTDVLTNIGVTKGPYSIFWEFIFPLTVGTFNGVGFARALPLSLLPSLWPVLNTWVGYIFRVYVGATLIVRWTMKYKKEKNKKQINKI